MQSTARPQTRPADAAALPRPDLYAPIHKALRHAMGQTLLDLGRIDTGNAAAFGTTLAQVEGLLDLCAGHLDHENRFVHPALEACVPGSAERIAMEHEEHEQSIAELRTEIAALRQSPAARREALALRLYRHLALFVAGNFQHMHVEETAHNAVLWAHYDDAALMELHGRIVAAVDAAEMQTVMQWMLPALTPAERALMGAPQAEAQTS